METTTERAKKRAKRSLCKAWDRRRTTAGSATVMSAGGSPHSGKLQGRSHLRPCARTLASFRWPARIRAI